MSPKLLTRDPRYRRREWVFICLFVLLLIAAAIFYKEAGRRLLAWKVAHGAGGMARLFDLARRGPEMIPYIEPYLHSEDPGVRGNAAMAIKAMQHPACLPVFHRMALGDDRDHRLMGLDGMGETVQICVFPLLVGSLRDPDEMIRGRSAIVLEELTGETFGYDPRAEAKEREAAVARWEAWLAEKEASRMGAEPKGE